MIHFPSDEACTHLSAAAADGSSASFKGSVALAVFVGSQAGHLVKAICAPEDVEPVNAFLASGGDTEGGVLLPSPISHSPHEDGGDACVYAVLAPSLLTRTADKSSEAAIFVSSLAAGSVIVFCGDGSPSRDQLPCFASLEAISELISPPPAGAEATSSAAPGQAGNATAASQLPPLLWVFPSLFQGEESAQGGGAGKGKGKAKTKAKKPKSGRQLMDSVLQHETALEVDDALESREHARAVLASLMKRRDALALTTSTDSPLQWTAESLSSTEVSASLTKLKDKVHATAAPLTFSGKMCTGGMLAAYLRACAMGLKGGGKLPVLAAQACSLEAHFASALSFSKALLRRLLEERIRAPAGIRTGTTGTAAAEEGDDSSAMTATTATTASRSDPSDGTEGTGGGDIVVVLPVDTLRLEAALALCVGEAEGAFLEACQSVVSSSGGSGGGEGGGDDSGRDGSGLDVGRIKAEALTALTEAAAPVVQLKRAENSAATTALCQAALAKCVPAFLSALETTWAQASTSTNTNSSNSNSGEYDKGSEGSERSSTGGGGGEESEAGDGGRGLDLWAERYLAAIRSLSTAYSAATGGVGRARWEVLGEYLAGEARELFESRVVQGIQGGRAAREALAGRAAAMEERRKEVDKVRKEREEDVQRQKEELEAEAQAQTEASEHERQEALAQEALLLSDIAKVRASAERHVKHIAGEAETASGNTEKQMKELESVQQHMLEAYGQVHANAEALAAELQATKKAADAAKQEEARREAQALEAEKRRLSDQVGWMIDQGSVVTASNNIRVRRQSSFSSAGLRVEVSGLSGEAPREKMRGVVSGLTDSLLDGVSESAERQALRDRVARRMNPYSKNKFIDLVYREADRGRDARRETEETQKAKAKETEHTTAMAPMETRTEASEGQTEREAKTGTSGSDAVVQ